MVSLIELAPAESDGKTVVVRRIGEPIQTDAQLMYTLRRAGVQPGAVVSVTSSAGGVLVGSGGEAAELEHRGGQRTCSSRRRSRGRTRRVRAGPARADAEGRERTEEDPGTFPMPGSFVLRALHPEPRAHRVLPRPWRTVPPAGSPPQGDDG